MTPFQRKLAYTYRGICLILAIPFIILTKIPLHDGQFNYTSNAVSLIPFLLGDFVRYRYYKYTIKSVGKDCMILFGSVIQDRNVSLGNNVTIGNYSLISGVQIGDDVLIGPYCVIMAGGKSHGYSTRTVPMRLQSSDSDTQSITIENDVWIGTHCTVMAPLHRGCIIGAGSIVTKAIREYSIAVGNPCKLIKERL